uniref:Uncharacterized protein n=1 Tax=Anolis carolinensis TaxID=28377 RepID=A0A803TUN7_ANOCA
IAKVCAFSRSSFYHPSIFIYPPSIYLSSFIYLCTNLSSIYNPSVCHLSIYLSIYRYISSIHLFIYLPVYDITEVNKRGNRQVRFQVRGRNLTFIFAGKTFIFVGIDKGKLPNFVGRVLKAGSQASRGFLLKQMEIKHTHALETGKGFPHSNSIIYLTTFRLE